MFQQLLIEEKLHFVFRLYRNRNSLRTLTGLCVQQEPLLTLGDKSPSIESSCGLLQWHLVETADSEPTDQNGVVKV